jgi:hypothetical protein
MTTTQKLLALDAMVLLCENLELPNPKLQKAIHELAMILQGQLDDECGEGNFGRFLSEQREAVKLLASEESLFGCQ